MAMLVIDDNVRKKIDDIVGYAAADPLKLEPMVAIAKENPESLRNFMATYTIKIPLGYQATYTQEIQRNGRKYHHISISVDRPGKLPSREALHMICEEFKMVPANLSFDQFSQRINHLEIETITETFKAVNIWMLAV